MKKKLNNNSNVDLFLLLMMPRLNGHEYIKIIMERECLSNCVIVAGF